MTLREDIARMRDERDRLRELSAAERTPTQTVRLSVLERLLREAPTVPDLKR